MLATHVRPLGHQPAQEKLQCEWTDSNEHSNLGRMAGMTDARPTYAIAALINDRAAADKSKFRAGIADCCLRGARKRGD